MIMLNSLQTLKVVLAGAVATNEPHLYASSVDLTATGLTPVDPATGLTSGATAVTLVAPPASGVIRQVKYLSCFNADTASVVATVFIDDDGDLRTLITETLAAGARLEYRDSHGFSA